MVTLTRWVGKCRNGHPFALDLEPGENNNPKNQYCSCGAARMRMSAVQGRVSETKCSSKCTGAVGPSCDCECGGRNHGAGFLQPAAR